LFLDEILVICRDDTGEFITYGPSVRRDTRGDITEETPMKKPVKYALLPVTAAIALLSPATPAHAATMNTNLNACSYNPSSWARRRGRRLHGHRPAAALQRHRADRVRQLHRLRLRRVVRVLHEGVAAGQRDVLRGGRRDPQRRERSGAGVQRGLHDLISRVMPGAKCEVFRAQIGRAHV
jgi:hypothetical protein